MNWESQKALITQSAILATLATQVPPNVDMTRTIEDLKGYSVSLSLVKSEELAPFGVQAKKLVTAALRYTQTRSNIDYEKATAHHVKLAQMMDAFLKGGV